jgi:hypothetical protein
MNTDLYAGKNLLFVTNNKNDWRFDFYFVQNIANPSILTPLFISKESQNIVNNTKLIKKIVEKVSKCNDINCSFKVIYNKPDEKVPTIETWTITKYTPTNIDGRNMFYEQLDEHKSEETEDEVSLSD